MAARILYIIAKAFLNVGEDGSCDIVGIIWENIVFQFMLVMKSGLRSSGF